MLVPDKLRADDNVDFGFDRLDAKVVRAGANACGVEFVQSMRQEHLNDPRWMEGKPARKAA